MGLSPNRAKNPVLRQSFDADLCTEYCTERVVLCKVALIPMRNCVLESSELYGIPYTCPHAEFAEASA